MRHQNALHAIRFTIVILLLSVFTRTNAQVQTMRPNTPMGTYVGGFFEYLPVGYSTTTQTFPLLIFIHGMGEIGVGDSASLAPILLHGPPMLIDRGTFPQTFSVDGQTFSFIVLSPQFSHWPNPSDVNDVINYAKAHYRVDPTRLYITGLSMGGGACWDYAAENSTYANTVTAIVPTGAASQPSQYRANIIAAGNVGVWAFHNDGDLSVPVDYTINWVNWINNAPTPPVPPAKMTIFHQSGHDAWTDAYDMTYTENGLNIYQWMLQFQKGRPFTANIPPLANAGPNQTVNFPDNTTLDGTGSKDPDGSIVSYTWSQAFGPNTATLSSTTIPSPSVTNLIVGLYRFKLTVVDNRGAVAESFVDVNVTPHTNNFTNGLAHVEAETYSYFNSVMTQPTTDVGGGLNAGGINAGSWMDYYMNVPATGTYTFRARVASPYDGDQMQFKDSNGVVLTTVALPNTNGWQTWQTATSTVTLQAGLQRIRIYCSAGAWNFNWFELQQGAGAPPPPPPATSKIVVNAGANQVITLPTSSVTLSGSATDSGSTVSTYQWTLVSGPSTSVTFSNAGAAQTTVSGLLQGTYIFQLRATDALGTTATASTQVIVNAAPVNKPPVVSAGSNQSITLPTNSVTLTGTASDPDGSIASTAWSQVSGPNTATIASPAQLQTNITGLVQGSYVFQLLAKDNSGATTTATATVTVNPAPVGSKVTVNAGSNQTITLPVSSVTLTGSASDSGSTISTYAWSQVSGPAQASFSNSSASSTSATGLVQGTYTFQFKATDALGNSSTSTVQVTVNPAVTTPPSSGSTIHIEAESFNNAFSIMTQPTSDAGGGLNVGGINTGSWMDYNVNIPSAGSYTFSVRVASPYPGSQLQLRKSDGTVLGTINIPVTDGWQIYATTSIPVTLPAGAQTLRIVSTNGAWNFNWFELAPGSGQQATSTPTANAGTNQSITLPTNSTTLTGTASDVGGTITSYQWTQTSGPNTATLGTPNAAQTTVGNLVQGTYVFQLKVTDNLGATATSTTQVTVNAAVVSTGGTTKYINVQVYGGSNPYVSSEWNNWNVGSGTDVTSGTFNYSDGTASSITAVLSNSQAIGDNGSNYASTIPNTMAPPAVLRYTSYSNSTRTLTIKGLNSAKKYNVELYASRYSSGNTSIFTVNGNSVTITTYDNYSDKASFSNITPDAQGQIVIGIDKGANYDYLNGFMITEIGSTTQTQQLVRNNAILTNKKKQNTDSSYFMVFPNPIRDRFVLQVHCNKKGATKVQIINSFGITRKQFHLVKDEGRDSQIYLSISDLPKGSYIIKIQIGDWTGSMRVIKE